MPIEIIVDPKTGEEAPGLCVDRWDGDRGST
jgi:hypothetical protein